VTGTKAVGAREDRVGCGRSLGGAETWVLSARIGQPGGGWSPVGSRSEEGGWSRMGKKVKLARKEE
jgi:hypothetical protein